MLDEILGVIFHIPAIIEFVIGSIIYFMVENALGEVTAEVAKATVCQTSGIGPWIMCLYLTNPLIAFIGTVSSVIGMGFGIRALASHK